MSRAITVVHPEDRAVGAGSDTDWRAPHARPSGLLGPVVGPQSVAENVHGEWLTHPGVGWLGVPRIGKVAMRV